MFSNCKTSAIPLPFYMVGCALLVVLWEWLVWFSDHAPTSNLVYSWGGTVFCAKIIASVAAVALLYLSWSDFSDQFSEIFLPPLAVFIFAIFLMWGLTTHHNPNDIPIDLSHLGEPEIFRSARHVRNEFINTLLWLFAFVLISGAAVWAAEER